MIHDGFRKRPEPSAAPDGRYFNEKFDELRGHLSGRPLKQWQVKKVRALDREQSAFEIFKTAETDGLTIIKPFPDHNFPK